jgi:hypothetical protein
MITSLESNGLRFDMFTGEERFIAPNAVLVSGRTDAVLIDCSFVKSDVDKHTQDAYKLNLSTKPSASSCQLIRAASERSST